MLYGHSLTYLLTVRYDTDKNRTISTEYITVNKKITVALNKFNNELIESLVKRKIS